MDILGPNGERRDVSRSSGLRSGFAVSHDGRAREACVVANLSAGGALLLVENPRAIDRELVLKIDGEQERRPARVVWRNDAAVAISFLTSQTDAGASDGWVFAPDQSTPA
jgi:hypothetical protein